MMGPMRALAPLLCAALVAACSATDYGAPVTAFGTAVQEGSRLVEAYGLERAEAQFALRRAVVAGRSDLLVLRGSDCRAGAAPQDCVLRVGAAGTPLGRGAPAVRPAELAGALATYAESLAAVAAATTEADFDASTKRLSAAVSGLAGQVQAGGSAATVIDPAAAIVAGIGGLVLQERRFALLRGAINAADPVVQQASVELGAVVAAQREAAADDRAALMARLVALYNAIEPDPGAAGAAAIAGRDALLGRIAGLVGAQRRLLADDPAALLRGLGEAHAALRRGVNDPIPSAAQIAQDLKRLSERLRRAADAALRLAAG